MEIGGLERFSLNDFPGLASAVVFTQGCNFRCPFCHNGQLIPMDTSQSAVTVDTVMAFLSSRRGKLDGVVVTGGEPCIQQGLTAFLHQVRSLGFATKLDTNGSHPEVVEELLRQRLVDYIAMDIKAPYSRYPELAGVAVDLKQIARSVQLIAASGVRHEFRTTIVDALLSENDVASILKMVPEGSVWKRQEFVKHNAFDPALRD